MSLLQREHIWFLNYFLTESILSPPILIPSGHFNLFLSLSLNPLVQMNGLELKVNHKTKKVFPKIGEVSMAEQEKQSLLHRNVSPIQFMTNPGVHKSPCWLERIWSIRRSIDLADLQLVSKAPEEISMAIWEDCWFNWCEVWGGVCRVGHHPTIFESVA